MFSIKDKIAVVTGASQGIGEAISRKLAEQGAHVVCTALPSTEYDLNKVVNSIKSKGNKASYITLDVCSGDSIRSAVAKILEQYLSIDILVNNAGITRDKLTLQMKEEDFDLVLDTNLKGAWLTTQAVIKSMIKKRYGRIINIASIVGQMGNIGQSNYSASKSGLIGLTKTMARELASRNITCNAIAPGYIETAMTDILNDKIKEEFNKQIPLGRMGTALDIANAVVFLASEESNYITGQVISVNGGLLMI